MDSCPTKKVGETKTKKKRKVFFKILFLSDCYIIAITQEIVIDVDQIVVSTL